MKAVVFDLDGTLVHSRIDFGKMKRRSIGLLEASGVEPGLLTEKMGNYDIERLSTEDLRTRGVSEEDIGKIFQKVSEIMNEVELEALGDVELFEGVSETLEKLKNRGLRIGIVTRSCREYADRVIERLKLRGLIDAVLARDDVSKPKPDPEHLLSLMTILGVKPSETVMVGDHAMDALCAQNAGVRFLLTPKKDADIGAFEECDVELLESIRDVLKLTS